MENKIVCSHTLLQRFFTVCECSGYRRSGVAKRVQENGNFIRVLLEDKSIGRRKAWPFRYMYDSEAFFREAARVAIKLNEQMYAPQPECFRDVCSLIGPKSRRLVTLQGTCRRFISEIHKHPKIYASISFVEGWLWDDELFFEDMKNALWAEGAPTDTFFRDNNDPAWKLKPWGEEYSVFLLKLDGTDRSVYGDRDYRTFRDFINDYVRCSTRF